MMKIIGPQIGLRNWMLMAVLLWAVTVCGQDWHVGDIFTAPDGSKGVVFYVKPDGSGGWAVALNDASSGCQWGDNNQMAGLPVYSSTLSPHVMLDDQDGYANTQIIRQAQNNAQYAAGMVDFENGWYLPAPAQLSLLYGQLPLIENVLLENDGSSFVSARYWCSAQQSGSYAWTVDFQNNAIYSGSFQRVQKTITARVRAVCNLPSSNMVYDTTLTYHWNTGSELPYTDGTPLQTTDYSVTVTTNYGCGNMASQIVVVISTTPQVLYDTVCAGEPYAANGFTFTKEETAVAGTYEKSHIVEANGCQGTVTMRLTVNPCHVMSPLVQMACGQYIWNGVTYYENGEYVQHFNNINGCDSMVTLHLTLNHADTVEITETACGSFGWNGELLTSSGDYTRTFTNAAECDSMVTLHLTVTNVDSSLSLTVSGEENTKCDGNGCLYDGPTILINEVMIAPDSYNGSIAGTEDYTIGGGEWIELYNPHKCQSVDISCYYLGNNAYDQTNLLGDWGGGFSLPQGTVVPPQGFCVVRGVMAPAVPENMLVSHGGNVVEVVVDSRFCVGYGGGRLWFPDLGGWFAFYDANGVPQDAICWGYLDNFCASCQPCVPVTSDCGSVSTLSSYSQIPAERMSYLGNSPLTGRSFSRIPDGSTWSSTTTLPTYAECNDICVEPPVITCNGFAVVSVSGGTAPYTYLWDDPLAQTTDTAFHLCAGVYTVTVTDAIGNTDSISVTITEYEPIVVHPDVHFCLSDSIAVLQGFPEGGTYTGLPVEGDTLLLDENMTDFMVTYTYSDSNACSASTMFQVLVTPNTQLEEVTVCSSELPYLWNGQVLSDSGKYHHTVVTGNFCDSVIILHLVVDPQPELTVSETQVINYGENVTLNVTGADHYEWSQSSSLSFTTSASPVVNPEQSTTYYVTGYSAFGCSATDSVKVIVRQYYDTVLCQNELPLLWHGTSFQESMTDTLTIPGENSSDQVLVLHVQVLPNTYVSVFDTVIEADLPVTFNGLVFMDNVTDTTVVIQNSAGCDSVITYSLYVCRNWDIQEDSLVCENNLPLLWNGQLLMVSGDYQADLQSFCGADSVVHLQMTVVDTALRIISLTEDFCLEMSAELTAVTGLTDYVWSTGDHWQTITVTYPGFYTVTASNGNCSNTANYMLENCRLHLYLPNAITPSNGDGLNDWFCIPESPQKFINDFEISIFNRWGEQVYYSTDKNFHWNGEFKGKIYHNTVYNYIIRYTDANGKGFSETGSVTVL